MSNEEKKEKKEEASKTESPFMAHAKEQRAKLGKRVNKPFGADLKGAAREAIEDDKKKKKKIKEGLPSPSEWASKEKEKEKKAGAQD